MSTHLLARVKHLQLQRHRRCNCEDKPFIGAIINCGDPMPDECEVVPCPGCGKRTVLVITVIVVDSDRKVVE
jgi:hypothetical protein